MATATQIAIEKFPDEDVKYANKLTKYNRRGTAQRRILVIMENKI